MHGLAQRGNLYPMSLKRFLLAGFAMLLVVGLIWMRKSPEKTVTASTNPYMEIADFEVSSTQDNGRVDLHIGHASLEDGKIAFFRSGATKQLVLIDVGIECLVTAPGANVGEMIATAFREAGLPVDKVRKIAFEIKLRNLEIDMAKPDGERIRLAAKFASWRSGRTIEMTDVSLTSKSGQSHFETYEFPLTGPFEL